MVLCRTRAKLVFMGMKIAVDLGAGFDVMPRSDACGWNVIGKCDADADADAATELQKLNCWGGQIIKEYPILCRVSYMP
jgi:hypothetical protein